MRKPIIAGNWKMNMTPDEARALIDALKGPVAGAGCDVVLCPPFTALETALSATAGTNIAVGAQNCHFKESGAYTGEVSPVFLQAMGVRYVILGHSERRQYFGETDELVNLKAVAALAHGLVPILCVGESLSQREAGVTAELVAYQTQAALSGLTAEQVAGLVIAYEPIWAIGTGRTATAEQANEVIAVIRAQVRKSWGDAADAVRIQYGGSMNAGNARELMAQSDIDGGLVGGASLKAADFAAIAAYDR